MEKGERKRGGDVGGGGEKNRDTVAGGGQGEEERGGKEVRRWKGVRGGGYGIRGE